MADQNSVPRTPRPDNRTDRRRFLDALLPSTTPEQLKRAVVELHPYLDGADENVVLANSVEAGEFIRRKPDDTPCIVLAFPELADATEPYPAAEYVVDLYDAACAGTIGEIAFRAGALLHQQIASGRGFVSIVDVVDAVTKCEKNGPQHTEEGPKPESSPGIHQRRLEAAKLLQASGYSVTEINTLLDLGIDAGEEWAVCSREDLIDLIHDLREDCDLLARRARQVRRTSLPVWSVEVGRTFPDDSMLKVLEVLGELHDAGTIYPVVEGERVGVVVPIGSGKFAEAAIPEHVDLTPDDFNRALAKLLQARFLEVVTRLPRDSR